MATIAPSQITHTVTGDVAREWLTDELVVETVLGGDAPLVLDDGRIGLSVAHVEILTERTAEDETAEGIFEDRLWLGDGITVPVRRYEESAVIAGRRTEDGDWETTRITPAGQAEMAEMAEEITDQTADHVVPVTDHHRVYRATITTAPTTAATEWDVADYTAKTTIRAGQEFNLREFLEETMNSAVYALFCGPEFTRDEDGVYGDPVPPQAVRVVAEGEDREGVFIISERRVAERQEAEREAFYGEEGS